ncbi:MAG: 2'-5' RNA ligase family protein [Luteolibacter sp.]
MANPRKPSDHLVRARQRAIRLTFGRKKMRAIHLFLDFGPNDAIADFRRAHDPLASKIPPHITLVFPFESDIGDDPLASHARQVADSLAPFTVTLGKAEQHPPDYIWLPVVGGSEIIQSLHHKLYSGPLAGLKSQVHRYQPHVTIGRVNHRRSEALFYARSIDLPSGIRVDRITIERICSNEMSEILHVASLGVPHAEKCVGEQLATRDSIS